MTGFKFKPVRRVKTKKEYASVFSDNKKKYVTASWLKAVYLPNTLEYARLGVIVSKKWSKSAVKRNLFKRIVREHFRQGQSQLPGCDIIVIAKSHLTPVQRAQLSNRQYAIKKALKKDMIQLWKNIKLT